MTIGGTYAGESDPDRFVWFRGLPDLSSRTRAPRSLYGGPGWRARRDVANASMIDSDDVLLLRPTDPVHRAPAPCGARPPRVSEPGSESLLVGVYTHGGSASVEQGLSTDLDSALQELLGVAVVAGGRTPAPRLPALAVRGDYAFVWAASNTGSADVLRGRGLPMPFDAANPNGDWQIEPDANINGMLDSYNDACAASDEIISVLDLDSTGAQSTATTPLRWAPAPRRCATPVTSTCGGNFSTANVDDDRRISPRPVRSRVRRDSGRTTEGLPMPAFRSRGRTSGDAR